VPHTDPAERYQPPLTWRSYAWRILLTAGISALAWGEVAQRQWNQHRALFWVDVALGVVCYVLVFFRRRWPLPIALVTAALSAFSGLGAGPATWAAVSLATRRVIWQVVVLGVVTLVSSQAYANLQPRPDEAYGVVLSVNAVATVAVLGWGMYIGSRRELLWSLRDQVARAAEEQELRAEQARSAERARIAREMHDVLAHRISQVSMHANALAFRDDLGADEMRESVGIIQEKANAALTDLRAVLGVLRDPETGALLDKPQPTYADIRDLVAEARVSGMRVEYDDQVAAAVPSSTGRTVYRIVQEGLTNARKHAPGAAVTVRISGSEHDGLDLLVRNPVGFGHDGAPRSGLGLVGLRERAELRGGRLETWQDGQTFVLHGWIPWE
jgi:signal transduction histidine kinase